MSLHHYFAIFLLVINVAAATVDSINNQQAPTVNYLEDIKLPPLNLDVDALTDESYQVFINKLINAVKGNEAVGGVPILPSNDNELFDVILKATDEVTRKVTVSFRRKNLYVRGYLIRTDRWMELREDEMDTLHMVDQNSEHLSFFGSYNALGSAARRTVTETPFTRENLKGAVTALFKSTEDEDRARFLIFMAQMISEAARLKDVSKFFGTKIAENKYVSLDLHDLQKKWSKYSTAVQCYYNYMNDYKFEPVKILGRTYNTARELRTIFGIMLKETYISDQRIACGIKKLADGDEGEAAVVLSADM